MSEPQRRRRFEDDDERGDDQESPRGSFTILPVAIAAGSLVLLVLAVGIGLFVFRAKRMEADQAMRADEEQARLEALERKVAPTDTRRHKQAVANPAPISRDEFRLKVIGKTAAEVTTELGEPDKIVDGGDQSEVKVWYYAAQTFDPANMKTDGNASLTFANGVVTKVEFVGGA
jgi:hypothetical protein